MKFEGNNEPTADQPTVAELLREVERQEDQENLAARRLIARQRMARREAHRVRARGE